jgi:elongation factor 1-delta
MVGTNPLAQETFWANKAECDDAEKKYYQNLYGKKDNNKSSGPPGSIAAEIAKARQHIKNSLECVDNLGAMAGNEELLKKVSSLEIENKSLKKVTDDLKNLVIKLENRVSQLEKGKGGSAPAPAKVEEEEDDDDVDLFGSDSEDEETKAEKERVTAERLKAYHEKKSKKPALIAKTSVLLDIKPWDDETDMNEMLKAAKTIQKEGLVWGASKLVPVGYGINKLQLMCVVEDEKVSIDELCEQISEFEDFVQSVDVAAMSKI